MDVAGDGISKQEYGFVGKNNHIYSYIYPHEVNTTGEDEIQYFPLN
jgi:hypothetical protein